MSFKYIKIIQLIIIAILSLSIQCFAQSNLTDYGDYEVYSISSKEPAKKTKKNDKFLKLSPRNGLNADGLGGFFVSETADKFKPHQLILGARYIFHNLSSTKGISYRFNEDGEVSSYETSLNWVSDWAEFSATIPVHHWRLNTPRTSPKQSGEDVGLGNMRFGFKATYLPDHSYYRFAYGAVVTATTGNPKSMLPAGEKDSDELKLYGCVTTSETDRAKANLELGTVLNSDSDENRFIYRLGLSYEAAEHVSAIGEFAGNVIGGDNKDTLDMVMGLRLAPTNTFTLELVYSKNLRTYRAYGWDDQFQLGTTIRW